MMEELGRAKGGSVSLRRTEGLTNADVARRKLEEEQEARREAKRELRASRGSSIGRRFRRK